MNVRKETFGRICGLMMMMVVRIFMIIITIITIIVMIIMITVGVSLVFWGGLR